MEPGLFRLEALERRQIWMDWEYLAGTVGEPTHFVDGSGDHRDTGRDLFDLRHPYARTAAGQRRHDQWGALRRQILLSRHGGACVPSDRLWHGRAAQVGHGNSMRMSWASSAALSNGYSSRCARSTGD